MNYREALTWLFGTQRFGIKLGLENSRRLFAALRAPSPNERIIHVAGTNGKGSVCAMIDAICRAQGYRTGLFTSPHLISFRERIRVEGAMIPEADVARGLTMIRELIGAWDPHPTFFEITTALALDYFRRRAVELIVLETGLGGRLDATNVPPSAVSVLTPIDYDHQKWLGQSLTEIAAEKAGIIKARIAVVSAPQPDEAAAVIVRRAAEFEAPLTFVREPLADLPIALPGAYQTQNAALAVAALQAGSIRVDEDAIARGLATVDWPGRFQRWDERTIIDGAHNPAAARILAHTWQEIFGKERATIILAVLADKDVAGICAGLAPIVRRILLPQIRSERALSPNDLAPIVRGQFPDGPVSILPSFGAAWEEACREAVPILITGSLHFVGEALAALGGEPTAFEECLQ